MVCLASIALGSISAVLQAYSGAHVGSGEGGAVHVGEGEVGEQDGGEGGGILDLHVICDRQPCDDDREGSEGCSWDWLE